MAITTNQRNAASTSAVDKAAYAPTSTETVRNILLAYIAENGGVDLTAPGPIGGTTPGSASFTTLAASGVVSLSNGTAALPSLHFGDSTTGIYRNASGRIGITTTGVVRVAIYDSGMYMESGALGINTSNWFRIGAGGVELTTTTGGGTYAPLYISNLTASGTLTTSVAGAASTPAVSVTGAPYTAGTATTNHPLVYANGGTAPTTWSTAGTYFGINAVSGFSGNLIDLRVNGGASVFKVSNAGVVTCTSVTASGVFVATPNTLTGAGAIPVSTTTTGYISTGAAQALTLADGANGQIKTIIHTSDNGSGVLTPTSKAGYTTITFLNVGDSVTLQYITGTGWCIIGIYGAVAA